MAFVETSSPDEEELKKQGLVAPELSGASGDIAGSGGPSLPSPQASGRSGFTDVNAYLDANREQASQMGDVVAGRVGQEAQGFKQGVDTAFGGFGSEIDSARNKPDASLVDEAIGNPVAFSGDPSKTAAFKKMLSGEYGGPTEFDPMKLAEFSQKASTIKSKAPDFSTSEGTKNYLYGSGVNPTQGQVELDNLLLGQDPTARGKITAAGASFQTLQDYLDKANQGASDKVKAAQDEAAASGAEAGRLKTSTSDFAQSLQTRADEANARAGALGGQRSRLQALFTALAKPGTATLSDDDRMFLESIVGQGKSGALERSLDFQPFGGSAPAGVGLSPEAWAAMNDPISYGEVFSSGKDPSATGANAWNVASKDDAAKLTALEALLGDSLGVYGDPDQLGAYQEGTVAGLSGGAPAYDYKMAQTLMAHPGGGAEANAQRQKDAILAKMSAAGIDTTRRSIPNGRFGPTPEPESQWVNRIVNEYLGKRNEFWS